MDGGVCCTLPSLFSAHQSNTPFLMDSANSGSFHSSSGPDDDDFDSRSDPPHSFTPSFSSSAAAGGFNPNLSSSAFVATSPAYLQPNSLLSLDFLRSSSADQQLPMSFGSHLLPAPMHSRSVFPDYGVSQIGKFPAETHGRTQTGLAVRNTKKRTRASRRAPTTVLTTDASNFRAMVQEFTGIPAPPLSASPYSRRLDLFGTSGHLNPVGPSLYPLRPSAQKIQPSSGNLNPSGSGSNYLNIQNPILSFQSLLQQPHQMLSSLEDQIQGHHHQFRVSDNADNNPSSASQRINNANYSDHLPARCDGTVDSWISPPD